MIITALLRPLVRASALYTAPPPVSLSPSLPPSLVLPWLSHFPAQLECALCVLENMPASMDPKELMFILHITAAGMKT